MKKLSKIVSVVLSLALCLGMASPAFAASFSQLQEAIDSGKSVYQEGKDENSEETGADKYKIEASKDASGAVNVKLWEDVEREKGEKSISVDGKKEGAPAKAIIDLNGKTIDSNPNAVMDVNIDLGWNAKPEVKFYEAEKCENGEKVAKLDEDGERIEAKSSGLNNGSAISVTNGADLTIVDSSAKTKMGEDGEEHYIVGTGTGAITGGKSGWGGGVYVSESSFTMKGGAITGNYASEHGGGLAPRSNSKVTLDGVSMTKNVAQSGGGAMRAIWGVDTVINNSRIENNVAWNGTIDVSRDSTLRITDSVVTANHATGPSIWYSGGIHADVTAPDENGETNVSIKNTAICGNTVGSESAEERNEVNIHLRNEDKTYTRPDAHLWGEWTTVKEATCTEDSVKTYTCSVCGHSYEVTIPAKGHSYDGGTVTKEATCTEDGVITYTCVKGDHSYTEVIPANGHGEGVWRVTTPAQPGVPGVETLVCPDCGESLGQTRPIPALPVPAIPDDDAGTTPDAATIEDQEVPLAGLMPLYMLLEELRQYEEIPEIELPEDFKWIDHAYAQAIYWGLQEELVADTEEEPLDPDEALTAGLMREVLVNFVERYLGLDNFVVTLAGEDDELVMDLGERLTAFYTELETALAKQEKAA